MTRHVCMEAYDPGRNCFRRWELAVSVDLFGAWMVCVTFGRINAPGRTITKTFPTERDAKKYVSAALARRRAAPRRIGVTYKTIHDDGCS